MLFFFFYFILRAIKGRKYLNFQKSRKYSLKFFERLNFIETCVLNLIKAFLIELTKRNMNADKK